MLEVRICEQSKCQTKPYKPFKCLNLYLLDSSRIAEGSNSFSAIN